MSTRALIEIKDSHSTWTLYAHHDGYPEFMKKRIEEVIAEARMSDVPNVLLEADKFTIYLISQFWAGGYKSLYMTKRNIRKEAGDTDIEYSYSIFIDAGIKLKSYKVVDSPLNLELI